MGGLSPMGRQWGHGCCVNEVCYLVLQTDEKEEVVEASS